MEPTSFDEFLDIIDDGIWEEKPVDIKTFVESEDYLNLQPLSEYQYMLVEASTQIFRHETLLEIFGEDEADRLKKLTVNEVIAQLGKGSGKDYCSSISIARIVYLLLCLKNPQRYYNKPNGDNIDILNIAVNSDQAQNVFFHGLRQRVENSPWFEGKYHPTTKSIEFDKNIRCFSGHSEREGWEGYNLIAVVLDEISGFAIESTTGNESSKTAEAIYLMYKQSVQSRFAKNGKVILLSFPRFKGDFIQTRYEQVIAEKEVIQREFTFKINDDLPDGIQENEFTISWDEDRIISYAEPHVFALKRPSWEVNPGLNIEDFAASFFARPIDTLARFACMPPDAIDAFFKSREKIEKAFSGAFNPFYDDWRFKENFKPLPNREYYVHVDLAQKHDRAAVALAHVETWVKTEYIGTWAEPSPLVKIDAVRYWTPTKEQNVNFTEIKDYILALRQRGFNIKLVTFDQWQSVSIIDALNQSGLEAEKLSVQKPQYEDLALLVAEERIKGYHISILVDELLQLRIMNNNKVDHPRKGGKDLADAVCGAAYNAVAHTVRTQEDYVVEAYYLEHAPSEQTNKVPDTSVIKPPKVQMPDDISWHLASLEII